MNVAGFPAFDYFGDGSFYLLDVPGVSRTTMAILGIDYILTPLISTQ